MGTRDKHGNQVWRLIHLKKWLLVLNSDPVINVNLNLNILPTICLRNKTVSQKWTFMLTWTGEGLKLLYVRYGLAAFESVTPLAKNMHSTNHNKCSFMALQFAEKLSISAKLGYKSQHYYLRLFTFSGVAPCYWKQIGQCPVMTARSSATY